jgi:vacuolar protein sorting-associated protein 11
VRVVSRALKVIRSFRAVDGAETPITHLRQIPATPLLVTISEDLSNDPILRVWALDRIEKRTGGPKCLCTVAIQNGKRQFPVSAFVALDDLSQVAVGFANGSVVVVRGDLIHDRGTKQRIVFESQDPVTGLEVKEGSTTVLYIATTGRLASLVISGKGLGPPVRTIENQGCGVGCMALDKETKDIIVVRDDAIYTYGPSGRGPSFAFDGPKKMVKMFKDYVCLVCPPRVAQVSRSKTFRRLGTDDVDDLFSSTSFNLLDTDLRFIAHMESLPSQVKEIFVEWGELYLLTMKGQVSLIALDGKLF